MRHNDARGGEGGGGSIYNDALKKKEIVEFQSSLN